MFVWTQCAEVSGAMRAPLDVALDVDPEAVASTESGDGLTGANGCSDDADVLGAPPATGAGAPSTWLGSRFGLRTRRPRVRPAVPCRAGKDTNAAARAAASACSCSPSSASMCFAWSVSSAFTRSSTAAATADAVPGEEADEEAPKRLKSRVALCPALYGLPTIKMK